MLSKTYKVENIPLYIYCEIQEYIEIIEKRMMMFQEIQINNSHDNYIKIYNNYTVFKINNKQKKINGKILHTDLYPLFYNVISNLINDNNTMLLHSIVLCYNSVGILVVGDFGHGKTSLCLEAINSKIKVLSTDQTILKIDNERLRLKCGSRYMKICDEPDIIINNFNTEIEIKYIFNLVGISDYGESVFKKVENNNHKIKILFKYLTWHADIPLFTDDTLLKIDRIKIKKWLTKVKLPLYNVRGDGKKVIKRIKEIIK